MSHPMSVTPFIQPGLAFGGLSKLRFSKLLDLFLIGLVVEGMLRIVSVPRGEISFSSSIGDAWKSDPP